MFNMHRIDEEGISLPRRADESNIGRLLKGSIDMHVHFGPDPNLVRRQNAVETAIAAREMGIGGIVLKSHPYPTAALATVVSQLVPGILVFGGVCLEYECGGVNPYAVEAAAKLGAKVVWMPVFSAANSRSMVRRVLGLSLKGNGISILGDNDEVTPNVVDVLTVVRDYDMVVATGHISSREILALVNKAKQLGLTKVLVTHATDKYISETVLSAEERQMLAKEGVLLEYTAFEITPTGEGTDPTEIADAIRNDGPEHCIISSDFGGNSHPTEPEGMRMFISSMLQQGLSERDITHMVKTNPARLLGI
jgi:hypothetical protein